MSALSIQPTFPIFTETDGLPLENGYIWIGTANLDPQGNPINVYWDAALTIAAAQPIRTLAGYPSRSGTPARVYVNSDYSIRVQDKNASTVYSAPQATERISSDLVTYQPPFSGGVAISLQNKLAQTVSVQDFGAVGDGLTNDAAAIQTAIDSLTGGGMIYFPPGVYLINTKIQINNANLTLYGVRGASVLKQVGNVWIAEVKADNITITGLKFIGDQSGGAVNRTNLLLLGDGDAPRTLRSNINVHHCDFLESSSTCVLISLTQDVFIQNNTMTNYWECATDCVVSNTRRIYITNNIAISSVVHPNPAVSRPIGFAHEPQQEGNSSDWYILDNYVDFSGIGVPNRNVTHGISMGKASSPPAYFSLKRWRVSGNIMRGVGSGIRITNARWGASIEAASLEISNNIIEAARDYGMNLLGGEDNTYRDSISIIGNTIKGYSEFSTNSRDGIYLDLNWFAPLISGNMVVNKGGETGTTSGRYAINIAAATVIDSKIGDNVLESANSGRINDASLTSTMTVVARGQHFYTNTSVNINSNIEYTPSTGSVLLRNPTGANREIQISTSASNKFNNGHFVAVKNTGTTGFNLIFDPVGVNVSIANSETKLFVYDGVTSTWVHLTV